MNITLFPGKLTGKLSVIPSKSQAHRLLICAAFSQGRTRLICPETNRDIDATAQCLQALGAEITREDWGYRVVPGATLPEQAELPCQDSGSTLRFLLPIVGALGVDATFRLAGRLPQRPLSPLWEEMERMGCALSRPTGDTIRCTGKLRPGAYTIDGSVSSQFITGLSFALCLMDSPCDLTVTGTVESRPYLELTRNAIALFGGGFGQGGFRSPGTVRVEGDWSNGGFWLAANTLGSRIDVKNLSPDSPQGDRAVAKLLPRLEENITISARDIPDLVPILAVVAACKQGAVFTDIHRLRLKESDRVASVAAMIVSLGGKAEAEADRLTIHGTGLLGGRVNAVGDHRIAMAAAIAATACAGPVTIAGAECADKSYPQFFREFRRLGGTYEQYLR